MKGFVNRHWRKLLFLASSVGAVGFGYYYIRRLLKDGMKQVEQFGKEMELSLLRQKQKQAELNRISSEVKSLAVSFLGPLEQAIKRHTDPKEVTERLKKYRKMSVSGEGEDDAESIKKMKDLWEQLKLISLSRLFGLLYGIPVVFIALQVQLLIVSREAFDINFPQPNKNQKEASKSRKKVSSISKDQRQLFLQLCTTHFLSEEAIEEFLTAIKSVTSSVTQDWLMGTDQKITQKEIIKKLSQIHSSLLEHFINSSKDWFRSLVYADTETNLTLLRKDQDRVVSDLLDEWLDLMESPMVEQCAVESFETMFNVLSKSLSQGKYTFGQRKTESNSNNAYLLTRVIVSFLKEASSDVVLVGDNETNEYLDNLYSLQSRENLTRQIFLEEDEDENPLGGLGAGLSSLGLSNEDFKAFESLLSGDDSEMMKMLQMIGDETAAPSAPERISS